MPPSSGRPLRSARTSRSWCAFFLRQAWNYLVDDDGKWIDQVRGYSELDGPLGGQGPALRRVLEAGADPQDVSEVVRCMQYELLFGLCYLLSDSSMFRDKLGQCADQVDAVGWALTECWDGGTTGRVIGGLHEFALEADPTGRKMRPKPRAR